MRNYGCVKRNRAPEARWEKRGFVGCYRSEDETPNDTQEKAKMPLIDVSTLVSLAGPMMQACKWIRDWWRCRKQVSVGGTPVTVAYGDIFQEKGIRVVGSTKYFEVEFGTPVEPRSLYGQFLEQRFQRKERDFEKLTRAQLGKEEEEPKKSVGRPLGWKDRELRICGREEHRGGRLSHHVDRRGRSRDMHGINQLGATG